MIHVIMKNCICGDFFCTDCKTSLINMYGFYKSTYCIHCNNWNKYS